MKFVLDDAIFLNEKIQIIILNERKAAVIKTAT